MEANANSPKSYKYATFPRQFLSYRWFKPILVALLTGVFMIVFQVILFLTAYIWSGDPNFANSFGDTYESMNIFTGPGALVEFGGIGVIVPALALATLIVRDRPFSSYASSRGGWNWGGFVKCLGIAFAVLYEHCKHRTHNRSHEFRILVAFLLLYLRDNRSQQGNSPALVRAVARKGVHYIPVAKNV